MSSLLEARKWSAEKRCRLVVDRLQKNGFEAVYVASKGDALRALLEMIPAGATVGVGGSVTLREIGVVDELTKRGNPTANHWQPKLSQEERNEVRRRQLTSDVFISSSNAVTMDGKLVNIDGAGNRVASMIFGPRKVIVVAGVNKIVKDVDEGIARVRNMASPMNAKRLGFKSPCGVTGECDEEHCEPPERLCHVITIIERRPSDTDFTVVLVGEELGY